MAQPFFGKKYGLVGTEVAQSNGLCIRGKVSARQFLSVVVSALIFLFGGGALDSKTFSSFFSIFAKISFGELDRAPTVGGSQCAENWRKFFAREKIEELEKIDQSSESVGSLCFVVLRGRLSSVFSLLSKIRRRSDFEHGRFTQ